QPDRAKDLDSLRHRHAASIAPGRRNDRLHSSSMDRSSSPTATPSTELERLLRVISSLPELELRVRWMHEYLHGPPELCAFVLNRLCEDALDGASRAREGLLPLVLCLVQLVDWEGEREAPLRQRLRSAAQEHGRHSLAR